MHADTTHTGKDTSDYFACWVLGESKKDKNFYMLDFVLRKCDVETQARVMIWMYQKFWSKVKKMTYDEKSNQWFGYWIKKLAKEEYWISLPIQDLKYPSDKVTHFEPHVPHFKANRVHLPSNNPMIQTATDQLLAFPTKWVHDDFVDLCSGVLDNIKVKKTYFAI
jgi:predicted phage terminase large subunit-like protein